MKKRIIITFAVDNTIDLITNSSSELFVLSGDTREIVTEMVESVYPEFRNEYDEIKSSRDLSGEELDYFFSFASSPGCWPASKNQYPIIPGFTFEDLYEPEDKDPAWNGEIQYQLKNNKNETEDEWVEDFWKNEGEYTMYVNMSNFSSRWGSIIGLASQAVIAGKPIHFLFSVKLMANEGLDTTRTKVFSDKFAQLEQKLCSLFGLDAARHKSMLPWYHPDCEHRFLPQDNQKEEFTKLVKI